MGWTGYAEAEIFSRTISPMISVGVLWVFSAMVRSHAMDTWSTGTVWAASAALRWSDEAPANGPSNGNEPKLV